MALPPLKIVVTATTAALDKSLTKTKANLAKFAKLAKAAMVAVGAAVVAAAGALAVMAKRSFEVIDSQAKLARSLKTSVASVQVLGRAADLAGVDLGQLNMAAIALDRRLSQAATGTGPAVDALGRLGLTAEGLADIDLDERVALINTRITELVPSAERAAVAAALFGDRAGFAIQRLDADTIAQATEELRELGVIVSDIDAAQIERTNDAVSKLSLITDGLGNQLAVKVAPALERFADGLAESAKEGGFVSSVISGLAATFNGLVIGAEFIGRAIANIWPIAKEVFGRFQLLLTSVGDSVAAVGYEIAALFDNSGQAGADAAYNWAKAGIAFEDATAPLGTISDILADMKAVTVEAGKAAENAGGGVATLGDKAEKAGKSLGNMFEKLGPLRDGFNAAGEGANQGAQQIQSTTETLNRGMEDALTSTITNYKNAGDAAMKFASMAVSELLRVLVVQKAIASFSGGGSSGGGLFGGLVKGIFGIAGAAVGGTTPAFGGSSIIPTSGAPTLSFAGGGYTGSGPRSGGVDGMGGMPAIVHPNETVIDHARAGSGSGGGGGTVVHQSFNLAPGLTADAIAAIRADILPQAQSMALAGVADARRRGGQRGAALR
jgi:hypothetical protein